MPELSTYLIIANNIAVFPWLSINRKIDLARVKREPGPVEVLASVDQLPGETNLKHEQCVDRLISHFAQERNAMPSRINAEAVYAREELQ